MSKAYYLSIKDDDDQGQVVVFANTAREAKKLIAGADLMWDEYIDIRVHRAKAYDGMEHLSPADLAKEQWRNGWRWFDIEYPDEETATDEEFYAWYNSVLGDAS